MRPKNIRNRPSKNDHLIGKLLKIIQNQTYNYIKKYPKKSLNSKLLQSNGKHKRILKSCI